MTRFRVLLLFFFINPFNQSSSFLSNLKNKITMATHYHVLPVVFLMRDSPWIDHTWTISKIKNPSGHK